MKHVFARALLLGAVTMLPGLAFAVPAETAPVTALDDALLAAMKLAQAGTSIPARAAALTPVVQQTYDLQTVTQNSVGFLWATLPAAQQTQLVDLFTQFTAASYASQFSGYGGERFALLAGEKSLGSAKVVETQIVPATGDATELDYVVTPGAQGWRITDVLLGGSISQVAVHESDFSALVTSGDASALIAALKSKIATLKGG